MVTDPQTQTHRQDRLQYTAPLSLARSVIKIAVKTERGQNVTAVNRFDCSYMVLLCRAVDRRRGSILPRCSVGPHPGRMTLSFFGTSCWNRWQITDVHWLHAVTAESCSSYEDIILHRSSLPSVTKSAFGIILPRPRRSIVVRTLVSAGELSLSCARLLAGWVTTLRLSRPLSVSQHGQLSHPSLGGR